MGCLIGWWSRRQHSISLSSAEAEYNAASVAGREGVHYRDQLDDIKRPERGATPLYLDSKATIDLDSELLRVFRSDEHFATPQI